MFSVCVCVCLYVCTIMYSVCVCVCSFVCMYVCTYVCVYVLYYYYLCLLQCACACVVLMPDSHIHCHCASIKPILKSSSLFFLPSCSLVCPILTLLLTISPNPSPHPTLFLVVDGLVCADMFGCETCPRQEDTAQGHQVAGKMVVYCTCVRVCVCAHVQSVNDVRTCTVCWDVADSTQYNGTCLTQPPVSQ